MAAVFHCFFQPISLLFQVNQSSQGGAMGTLTTAQGSDQSKLAAIALLESAINTLFPSFFTSNGIEKIKWDQARQAAADSGNFHELANQVDRCIRFLPRHDELYLYCAEHVSPSEEEEVTSFLSSLLS
jgi:hypothetical protein